MLHFIDMSATRFKKTIEEYYHMHGRHDLPWRHTRDPYAILVSEIMLQQTQVTRVKSYYENFLKKFPNFRRLARAKKEEVLRAWQGLGYNRRALALWNLSRIVSREFNGNLPRTREQLEALPGIGRGTSGAVSAFAFNKPEVFIETNIRRVFIHFFFSATNEGRASAKKVTDDELARYIKSTLDVKNPREWYYALMDYGAMLGTSASASKLASANPNRRSAHYKKQSPFKGSDREIRGKLLRSILAGNKPDIKSVRNRRVFAVLKKEGFL